MNYEELEKEVSKIQFHTDFDQKTKNKMIKKIEKQMEECF